MHLLALAETIQLFPDGTLFIHVGLILVMIWVLNRTLYRPLNRVIAAREKNKGGHSSEAVTLLKDVEEKETHYSRELLETRSKGYELIEKEQKAATEARDKQLSNIKAEVASSLESGKAELAKQAADAQAAMRTDAEKIADSIAASILKG
ncbi:MAG TPA: ATP synthase F0 subunit B [Pyrinomonadaceae bacterium]|nr:ATP synthase F0 subunit B [Acidobacteriota bacterium]HQZ95193.1 ATP synthase F0 subunit B [Pyrinomonadaceae bacterium]